MPSMDTDEVNPYQLLARLWKARIFIGTVVLLCGLAAAGWVYHWTGTTKLSLLLGIVYLYILFEDVLNLPEDTPHFLWNKIPRMHHLC